MTAKELELLARKAFDVATDLWQAEMPGWWALSWDRLDDATKEQYRDWVRKVLGDE